MWFKGWKLTLWSALVVSVAGESLQVKLTSGAPAVPFYLQLLESVAAYDETLFQTVALAIVQNELGYEELQNDERIYHIVHNSIDLETVARSLIDLRAQTKYYLPRIQSHYQSFLHEIDYENVLKSCETDGFGSKINRDDNEPFAWLSSGDRIYCTPDDLFALQLSKKSDLSEQVKPFDRVFGSAAKAPLLVLYGDLNHVGFRQMFDQLYQSAESGKLRFIWRYVPYSSNTTELLPNYGARVSLKDADYNDIDSEDTFSDLFTPDNIKQLGLKLTSGVLTSKNSPKQKYSMLSSFIQELPHHVDEIDSYSIDDEVARNVAANERLGLSESTAGLFVNGAPVNRLEMDVFKLINKVEEEAQLIQNVMELGFNLDQARTLLTKFALNRAIALSEFDSGGEDNRYNLYQHEFVPEAPIKHGGVVFINNIEYDPHYEKFSRSREEIYLGAGSKASSGQVPPLKENIHDMIFAINLSDKEQLQVLFTFSKVILDKAIPQQIGIIALGDSYHDKTIAKYFYYLYDTTDSKEALALLYKVFTRQNDEELESIYDLISYKNYEFEESIYQNTLKQFSIEVPSVIFNGVIHDISSDKWRAQMGSQIAKDVHHLLRGLRNNDIRGSMKSYLFKDAKNERNLKIIPKDLGAYKFKAVPKQLISSSTAFRLDHGIVAKDDLQVWLIGDLSSATALNQFINILQWMDLSSFDVQLRAVDTSTSKLLNNLKSGTLDRTDLETVIKLVWKAKSKPTKKADNEDIKKFLSENNLPPHHSFMLVNSRYFRVEDSFTPKQLEQAGEFEYTQRIGLVDKFMEKYPDIFNGLKLQEFHNVMNGLQYHDWKDLVISLLTKSFHVDDTLYIDDVARFDFGSMNQANSLVLDNDILLDPLVDVFVIIDPLLPSAQDILSVLDSCFTLPFVRTRILIQPQSEYTEMPKVRMLKGVYPKYPPVFDEEGMLNQHSVAEFNLPPEDTFTLDLVPPKRWNVGASFSLKEFDPDNIQFALYADKTQEMGYTLSSILIEGFARDVGSALPPLGLSLKLDQGHSSTSTMVMSNLGYFQLGSKFGAGSLTTLNNYKLLSGSTDPFDANTLEMETVDINVFTLDGLVLRPRVSKKDSTPKLVSTKQADINIFSVATGHLYERLTTIMMTSITLHTKASVKFWLLENYLSPKFKSLLPVLAEKHNFQYEYITYKWPMWLRQQSLKQRTIWGYKILFLDVLFPVDLDQVIFVDADQINRSDMKELADLDMEDKPYGFVPMCDSRKEMDGFRFWKQGYWSEVLGEDLKYHISALFKVNLNKFREVGAGDRLRTHYQKLSSDPNSLSNLDQDLPNNLQRKVPIYSLPQEYLWCETWCSDGTFGEAKNIDLCNNPLSKESKVMTARRLVPEWTEYDEEVRKLEENVVMNRPVVLEGIPLRMEEGEEMEEEEEEMEHDEL